LIPKKPVVREGASGETVGFLEFLEKGRGVRGNRRFPGVRGNRRFPGKGIKRTVFNPI